MDLILWRHAEAGDRLDDPQADLERPLSPKGERQARRVADWLNQFLPDSARVLSSPALRCLQTVAPLGRRVKKAPALGPDGDVEGLLAATRWPDSREAVVRGAKAARLKLRRADAVSGSRGSRPAVQGPYR